jgi:predicted transcriptional regulator
MYKELDPLLHSQLRLAIVSFLIKNDATDFNELKEMTGATSGNISIQIKKLQEVNYIEVKKGFLNNYQHTSIKITKVGISAFENYVKALKAYL